MLLILTLFSLSFLWYQQPSPQLCQQAVIFPVSVPITPLVERVYLIEQVPPPFSVGAAAGSSFVLQSILNGRFPIAIAMPVLFNIRHWYRRIGVLSIDENVCHCWADIFQFNKLASVSSLAHKSFMVWTVASVQSCT